MDRRKYITTLGTVGIGATAGCLGIFEGDSTDQDPTPTDDSDADTTPNEQSGDALQETAREHQITVGNSSWSLGDFNWYSYNEAELEIEVSTQLTELHDFEVGDDYSISVIVVDAADLYHVVAAGESDSFEFEAEKTETVTVPLDWEDDSVGTDVYYIAVLRPASIFDGDFDITVTSAGFYKPYKTPVTLSDPLTLTQNGLVERDSAYEQSTGSIHGDGAYSRANMEGAYYLTHNLPENPTPINLRDGDTGYYPEIEIGDRVEFPAPKMNYYTGKAADPLPETDPENNHSDAAFEAAQYMKSGIDSGVGNVLSAGVRESAYETGNRTQPSLVQYATTFVQSLDYIPSVTGTDFETSPQYAEETLIDGNGTCVDSTIVLGTILGAMGVTVGILHTDENGVVDGAAGTGHIALGVAGSQFDGIEVSYDTVHPPIEDNGHAFYYVESTAQTGIGTVPDEFRHEQFSATHVETEFGQ